MARDQLMAFLDFVKPSMQAYSTFCNHKSAIVCSFRILFGFELGKDPLITQWMKGWKIELPLSLGIVPMRMAGMLGR